MEKQSAIPWPNNLGWDVGEHEIWKIADGYWGIRLFKNGEPYKSYKVHPTKRLLIPLTHYEAILMAERYGEIIE